MALVIWGSALIAGFESVNKLLRHGGTVHVGWGIAAAAVGIAGNQLDARCRPASAMLGLVGARR